MLNFKTFFFVLSNFSTMCCVVLYSQMWFLYFWWKLNTKLKFVGKASLIRDKTRGGGHLKNPVKNTNRINVFIFFRFCYFDRTVWKLCTLAHGLTVSPATSNPRFPIWLKLSRFLLKIATCTRTSSKSRKRWRGRRTRRRTTTTTAAAAKLRRSTDFQLARRSVTRWSLSTIRRRNSVTDRTTKTPPSSSSVRLFHQKN